MSETSELVADGLVADDELHSCGAKRRVAYIAGLEYIQLCDYLPKVTGRVRSQIYIYINT